MKKILFIIGLCFLTLTSFGKKVIVLEVHKEGDGWQNFFNCYARVMTNFNSIENGTTYVTLSCTGNGFNFCRASREIGEISTNNPTLGSTSIDVLRIPAIIDAINNLIANSENVCKKGSSQGSSTQKVAVKSLNNTQMFFVKATWNYNQRDLSKGNLIITIEEDDYGLLNNLQRHM